jgi:hypothetical protein
MGRPFVAPAAVPADRVRLLRESVLKTLADPALQQEAAKLGREVDPMPGDAVQSPEFMRLKTDDRGRARFDRPEIAAQG